MSAPNGFVIYPEPEKSSFFFLFGCCTLRLCSWAVFWSVSGFHEQLAHNKPLEADAVIQRTVSCCCCGRAAQGRRYAQKPLSFLAASVSTS
jgi:hypothetical protein